MAIASPRFFSSDPAQVRSMKGLDLLSLFNDHIIPGANELDVDGENDAATKRRDEAYQRELEFSDFRRQEDDAFLAARGQAPEQSAAPVFDYLADDGPTAAPPTTPTTPARSSGAMKVKLANYGYDSDLSPDRNSNVLRIGHNNNKLEDGVSAAVTRSLAKRLNLEKGAWFTAHTADGAKYRRRYDDTVPTTYKGKKLPETVDLFRPKDGSNKFGGAITNITLD